MSNISFILAQAATFGAAVSEQARGPDLLGAALDYARAGVPVFPCVPLGKAPLTHQGFKDASTSPAQIHRWWQWQPEANIALVTGAARSRIDILDIDVHPGGDGFAALEQVEQAGLIDSWQRIVRSPSGGLHVVFPSNPSPEQRSWAVPTAHVDFLANGSYVLAPPSRVRTRDGSVRSYEVVATGARPAPVAGWRLESVLRPARTVQLEATAGPQRSGQGPRWDAERLADWMAGRPEGNRNRSLFWAACRLAETGTVSTQQWETLAQGAVRAGLQELEAVRTIQSAQRSTRLAAPVASGGVGAGEQRIAL
ncbi:bifunctional DNA primase/polymerase [Gulosibacter molinativorax]|uniref:bifunctional DNA primase/polymerase n=1 Tax=Gulosibacter molinativorax TaxID=256821 RepID=UPI000420B3C0|nr:bifunctional DNA primase/polymerase [Gulosibacter molinativorax]QUY61692.1 DNA primase [Gulosibacter molinativorax]